MTTIDTSRESLPRLIAVEEFFAEPEFAVPVISADGTRIAYLAPHRGRRNIWVRGIDQTHDDAVPVTHDTRRGITTYHWTDDPRWLLYLQDTDGNGGLAPAPRRPRRTRRARRRPDPDGNGIAGVRRRAAAVGARQRPGPGEPADDPHRRRPDRHRHR